MEVLPSQYLHNNDCNLALPLTLVTVSSPYITDRNSNLKCRQADMGYVKAQETNFTTNYTLPQGDGEEALLDHYFTMEGIGRTLQVFTQIFW